MFNVFFAAFVAWWPGCSVPVEVDSDLHKKLQAQFAEVSHLEDKSDWHILHTLSLANPSKLQKEQGLT